MQKRFIFLFIFIFFTGCSHKNAFSSFNMNEHSSKLVTNTQTEQVKYNGKVAGIIKVIYLNSIEKSDKDSVKFLVALYLKEKTKQVVFKCNEKLPSKIENGYLKKDYIQNNHLWNDYFVVSFKEKSKKLNFQLLVDGKESSSIVFTRY